ncbi:MAG: hypothetical protein MI702_13790 [Chlorobiales bacterium]|nr:hypothetical protein [Chlorobiales bacterium]
MDIDLAAFVFLQPLPHAVNTVAGLLLVLLVDQTYQLPIQFPLFEHIRGMIEELMFPL